MRAIFIDAERRRVQDVQIDEKDNLGGMQELVDGHIELAHVLDEHHDVYVNEEGMMVWPEHFFMIEGARHPYAGNGVIVGRDGNGETTETIVTAKKIKPMVKFMSREEVSAFLVAALDEI